MFRVDAMHLPPTVGVEEISTGVTCTLQPTLGNLRSIETPLDEERRVAIAEWKKENYMGEPRAHSGALCPRPYLKLLADLSSCSLRKL